MERNEEEEEQEEEEDEKLVVRSKWRSKRRRRKWRRTRRRRKWVIRRWNRWMRNKSEGTWGLGISFCRAVGLEEKENRI